MSSKPTATSRVAPIEPHSANRQRQASLRRGTGQPRLRPQRRQGARRLTPRLRGYLGLSSGLHTGALSRAERERLAILTVHRNDCGYCLAPHTHAGRAAGLSEAELQASRDGAAGDPRGAALLRLATAVIDYRGDVPDDELVAARGAGLTDAELIEVVAEVSLNTFTTT